MIRHPTPGQRVRLRYAKRFAHLSPHHGAVGVVLAFRAGRGPRNVLVEIDGRLVVVPTGNVIPEDTPTPCSPSKA